MNVIDYLIVEYDWEEGQNYHRFNGVVDIYKKGKVKRRPGIVAAIFIIPEKKFYYPKSVNEQMDIVLSHLEFYKELRAKKSHMDNKPRFTNNISGKRPQKAANGFQRVSAGGLKDDSPMPFGQHKGDPIISVPAQYLLWLFENNKCSPAVALYVSANMDVLRSQAKQTNR